MSTDVTVLKLDLPVAKKIQGQPNQETSQLLSGKQPSVTKSSYLTTTALPNKAFPSLGAARFFVFSQPKTIHMKRFAAFPLAVIFAALSPNTQAQQPMAQTAKVATAGPAYQVRNTITGLGNKAYAQKVLQAWKAFDENRLDDMTGLFTEDVVATFPDGTMVKGRDNFLKMGKEYRNSLSAIESTVDACTAMKSAEHPEMEAVSIWGMEVDTHKDGTVTKTHLNEIWFFNKEGKVYEFHQMAAKEK